MGIPAFCALYERKLKTGGDQRQPVPSVSTPSRYPLADTLEVLKSDSAAGVAVSVDPEFSD